MRYPSKRDALKTICAKGANIKSVIDIGILTETRELIDQFPDKKHFLVEPIEEYYGTIRENYKNVDFKLFECAASSKTIESNLEIKKIQGGMISHSAVTAEKAGDNIRPIKCVTLDDLMEPYMDSAPFLMKIDVDGHEPAVLEGAQKVLEKTDFLIIECPINLFHQRMDAVKQFAPHMQVWDIVDLCYWEDNLWQMDLIYIRDTLRQSDAFNNYPKVHTEGFSKYTCF